MSILPKIYTLKDEAQAELYDWFDKEVRPLPKNSDGTINEFAEGLVDNDIEFSSLENLFFQRRFDH